MDFEMLKSLSFDISRNFYFLTGLINKIDDNFRLTIGAITLNKKHLKKDRPLKYYPIIFAPCN
tara:strand:+ start:105112 stop:105300 length:189 start_codon:yes stop_codon:yes gene_type:complete